ncbi:DUF3349 domain-containing protein [Mycobacterium noviomagense]|uniref:Endonuclease n=1 Tax=Mycobacterium noviomagense TaxID=459858 RepID=A0A7I7PGQ3_9MYCO|nr:DUF3349 domain-containing protein [Mycobacterium noviomagense]ORB13295.1 endonuclease [Mycobacterium noviomagense]BBY07746.1 hypothetical protein MNVI_30640 [Mycobacterium noviomagense]
MASESFLSSVLEWLQTGYPDGVPGPDRVPLLALLRGTDLTEDQVREVVQKITTPGSAALADGTGESDDIAEFVSDMTHYDAGPENIRRVAGTLAAAGWPLQGVDLTRAGDDAGRATAS